jgi:hypothetical protein
MENRIGSLTCAAQNPVTTATKFIRRMRGGSQAALMEADDGNFYVVKMLGNPQGSNILFRDALGSELMRLVGLPVPAWKPISISACLARSNELRFQLPSGSTHAPARGPHFASLFIARDARDSLYETLPTPWISRLVNRDHFIGALMVDLWTNNEDSRQAIFLEQGDSEQLHAFFVDQGYQFSNKSEHPKVAIRRVQFTNRGVYRCSGLENLLLEWEARLAAITKDSLEQMVVDCNLPALWCSSPELEKAIDLLIERQSLLSSFRKAIQEDLSTPEIAGRSLRLYKNGNFDTIQIRGVGSCF